jgi:hypothetical protein
MDTAVFVSTNGGGTWRMSARPSADAKLIDAIEVRNGRLYAGTFGTGVFVSDDLGTTWQSFNQGLVGGILDSQLDVSDLESRGDSLMASTFGAGVYVRNLAGVDGWHPFGAVFEPNQAPNVNDLALGGTRLLACAGSNGTTFHRDLGTADWTLSLLGNTGLLPGVGAQTALFTGSRWVVGTNLGVFLSASGEEPWTRSSTRLAGMSWSTFAHIGQTLFAAFDSVNTILMEESHDGGTTWIAQQRVTGPFAYQLAVHGGDLYIARSDGLWIQPATTTSVVGEPGSGRLRFSLAGPQPIRDQARLRFELPTAGMASIEVFDVQGRRAAERIEGSWSSGPHEVSLDTRRMSPGVYAARLTAAGTSEVLRLVQIR